MEKVSIGGQALMEGVMMQNKNKYATAVRKPDGDIDIKVTEYQSFSDKYAVCRLPLIRGIVRFVESMVIGIKSLTYSSAFFETEEERMQKKENTEKNLEQNSTTESLSKGEIAVTLTVSFLMAIVLFMVVPNLITNIFRKNLHSEMLFAFIEGVMRVCIFLLYVCVISKMSDIKRVFAYHGAEHKTINCLEHGEDLTPENVLKYSRFHKRCGTSFLVIVMVISIFFFMFIRSDNLVIRLFLRLLLLPVIAGVSYEFLKFAGKSENPVINVLSKPGLWIQKLTTKEPDLEMAEVAIASVEAVLDWRAYLEAMRNNELEEPGRRK